jgi:hypothetical protein
MTNGWSNSGSFKPANNVHMKQLKKVAKYGSPVARLRTERCLYTPVGPQMSYRGIAYLLFVNTSSFM